jgi:hypothetical protein
MRRWNRVLVAGLIVAGVLTIGGSVAQAPALTPPPPLAAAPATCHRYAAEEGSDSAPGTWRRPVRSIQRLHDLLRPGQSGCVRRGTYGPTGEYVVAVSRPNITIQSYPGERALLRGLIMIRPSATRSRLARLDIEGTGGANTIQWYATDFTLEDSDITNKQRGRSCMILGDDDRRAGIALRPVIRRNVFHECGATANGNLDHAIYAQLTADGVIADNVFWSIAAYSMHLYPNAQRTLFSHNVIDGGSPSIRGGVIFAGEGGETSNGNVVERNVIAYSAYYNIHSYWNGSVGSGNVARANCVYGAGRGDIGDTEGFSAEDNVVAQPQFVDRDKRDYRLRPDSGCLSVVGYDTAAKLAAGR